MYLRIIELINNKYSSPPELISSVLIYYLGLQFKQYVLNVNSLLYGYNMPEHNDEQSQEVYATLVEVNQEPTELYKILKIGNLVSGGGEAKQVISEGYVFLNGEEETRKRKKVYAGDLVGFNGELLQVALKGQLDQYEVVESTPEENIAKKQTPAAKKRKPISF